MQRSNEKRKYPEMENLFTKAAQFQVESVSENLESTKRDTDLLRRRKSALEKRRTELEGRIDMSISDEYDRWDIWGAEQDVAEKNRILNERSEKLLKTQKKREGLSGCNHDKSAERAIYDLSTKEQISKCKSFKQLGNDYYKEGQWYRAAAEYRRVSVYFDYCFPDTLTEEQEVEKILQQSQLNLACCKIRTQQYSEACSAYPTNVKALYRRAKARRLLFDFSGATDDITKALKIKNNCSTLIQEKSSLQKCIALYNRRSKMSAKRMFASTSTKTNIKNQVDNGKHANEILNDLDNGKHENEILNDLDNGKHENEILNDLDNGKETSVINICEKKSNMYKRIISNAFEPFLVALCSGLITYFYFRD